MPEIFLVMLCENLQATVVSAVLTLKYIRNFLKPVLMKINSGVNLKKIIAIHGWDTAREIVQGQV